MDIQSLMNKIDEQREDLISLHQELVKIPSVNTGFMPTGNETAVCNFVKDWLKKHGIESEILARDPDRGNNIASNEGKVDKPSIKRKATTYNVADTRVADLPLYEVDQSRPQSEEEERRRRIAAILRRNQGYG